MGTVVVGVDGSENSDLALQWAAAEARRRGATLKIIHAWTFHDLARAVEDKIPHVDLEKAAHLVVDRAREAVGSDIEVETEVSNDLPAKALIVESKNAELLVVGSRGMGGFKGLLVGSVSQACVHHSHCPVVVVPDPNRP